MSDRKKTLQELKRHSLDSFLSAEKNSVVIILDNIRSGLNVGSIFRTADAFAIESIVLCGICCQPPHKEIMKTAIGADKSVNWVYYQSSIEAVEDYKSRGYKIAVLEQTLKSVPLNEFNHDLQSQSLVLVLGNEVKGVTSEIVEMADLALEIPQFGTKHSLNVSVSCGVALWEILK